MRRLLAAFAVAQAADLATTLYGVRHGATEQNGIGAALLAHPFTAVLAKVGLVVLAALLLSGRRDGRALRRTVRGLTVATFVVAGWNVLQVAI